MSDPVFFKRGPGLTVANIVELTGATLVGAASDELRIIDIAAPDRAGPGDLTFVDVDESHLARIQAGACFVGSALAKSVPSKVTTLVVDDPYAAFVAVATALYPHGSRPSSLFETAGAAANALVHPTARVEAGVTIDPAAMIGPRAEIGAGTLIGPMAVIGPDVRIGRDCSIGAGASLTNALLGNCVVIQPGCRIGQPPADNHPSGVRPPQLGRVILQDGVEVGPNGVIERGGYRDTIIGEATLVEALLWIPADAEIGRHCRIVARHDFGHGDAVKGVVEPFEDGVRLIASQLA